MDVNENQLITNVATKLVEDAAKGLWSKVKCHFQELSAREEIDFGYAYEEYIKNTRNKNCKTKTIIYRHVPKDLYSFYECVGVFYDGRIVNTDDINNLQSISKRLIVTGSGGIGKTTLLKHLFLNTLVNTNCIPVLIELRSLNTIEIKDISIYKMIYESMVTNGFKVEERFFDYSLEKGGYVLLFDGYDEINKEKEQKVTHEIRALSSKYPENSYVITSRPTDAFLGWNDYTEVCSLKLTKEQALSLINKIEFNENVKQVFYKELADNLYDKYESFASNPLLLTIMLLTFDSRASIPDKLNDFYEQAFATLFNMHDATKDAYVRDIRSGLGCEDFKTIFSYICFKSYFKGQYEFTESSLLSYIQQSKDKYPAISFKVKDFQEDLVQAVCMLVKEGLNYRFTHRSFQEYFAAWYSCKLEDEVQNRLLTNWLKESDYFSTASFIMMLFNLQSDKVNKIIFCPGLKIIRELLQEHGFSIQLLDKMFKGIGYSNKSEKLVLFIKNKYLCSVLRMTCQLNGCANSSKANKQEKVKTEVIASKLKKQGVKKFSELNFNEMQDFAEENEILDALMWFKKEIDFGIDLLERYEENKIGSKRKVASILEEL